MVSFGCYMYCSFSQQLRMIAICAENSPKDGLLILSQHPSDLGKENMSDKLTVNNYKKVECTRL